MARAVVATEHGTSIEPVMVRDVVTCRPDDALSQAAHSMWNHDCGVLPVVDPEGGELCGIITDRDICMAAWTKSRALDRIRVAEVMSKDVSALDAGSSVRDAHEAMRRHKVRRLPVVDAAGLPIGMVSLNDLAIWATGREGTPADRTQVAETLGAICEHRKLVSAR